MSKQLNIPTNKSFKEEFCKKALIDLIGQSVTFHWDNNTNNGGNLKPLPDSWDDSELLYRLIGVNNLQKLVNIKWTLIIQTKNADNEDTKDGIECATYLKVIKLLKSHIVS